MPAMHFSLRWPDGRTDRCYSPSLVVKEHVDVGGAYAVDDFVARMRTALGIASARVQQKYGHPCSLAHATLARIESGAASYRGQSGAEVTVTSFEE